MIRGRLAMLFALLALACGCGSTIDHSASDRIAAMLPRILGPAKSYDVQATGTSLRLTSGHLGKVVIHGEDVAFTPQLTVDTLDAQVDDIDLDTRSRRITGMGPIHFTAGVSAAHRNAYLAATAAQAPTRPANLAIALGGQSMTLSFTVRPLLVDVPVSVTGTLAPRPGRLAELDFLPTGGHVSIVPVPADLVNLAIAHANPVVDLSTLSIPLGVNRAWVSNGCLYLSGTAAVPPSRFSGGAS